MWVVNCVREIWKLENWEDQTIRKTKKVSRLQNQDFLEDLKNPEFQADRCNQKLELDGVEASRKWNLL